MTRTSTLGGLAALLMFIASALMFVRGAHDGTRLAILAGGVCALAGSLFLYGATRRSNAR